MNATGDWRRAAPFIGHFLAEYSCHFPDRQQALKSVTARAPYYMALNLLRIARNDYIGRDYAGRLVKRAENYSGLPERLDPGSRPAGQAARGVVAALRGAEPAPTCPAASANGRRQRCRSSRPHRTAQPQPSSPPAGLHWTGHAPRRKPAPTGHTPPCHHLTSTDEIPPHPARQGALTARHGHPSGRL